MRGAIRSYAFAVAMAIAVFVVLPNQADAQQHYGGGDGQHYYGPSYYGHHPYGYGGYGYGGYGYGGFGGFGYRDDRYAYGEVRIEATPKTSRDQIRVYVDEALAGVVDDFDGFLQRLHLAPGKHLIEIELDGYRPFRGDIMISPGRTYNIRGQMELLANDTDDAESALSVTTG